MLLLLPPVSGAIFLLGKSMKVLTVTSSLLCLILAGCSSIEELVVPTSEYKSVLDARENSITTLAESRSCCEQYQQMPYKDLPISDSILLVIDGSSPVYKFQEGNSFFSAYRLPVNTGDLKITVSAQVDSTVYFPAVIMLDSQFKPTRYIAGNIFEYKPAKFLDPDRVEAVFTVDRSQVGNPKNESYMIIYSPSTKLNDTTTVIHPANLQAKALHVDQPGIKNPEIPHSAWGLIKLSVEDLSSISGRDNMYKPVYQDTIDANLPKVDTAPNKLAIAPAAATAGVVATAPAANQAAVVPAASVAATTVATGTMLAETEAMYNQLIQKAISSGDIEKAMALASEAERAGSGSAKQTLVNAIKNSQK
jgi:maltose operon periplasmic protein